MYGDPLPNHQILIKSSNIFAMVIWGPTVKFNSCQYFWLYGIHVCIINYILYLLRIMMLMSKTTKATITVIAEMKTALVTVIATVLPV